MHLNILLHLKLDKGKYPTLLGLMYLPITFSSTFFTLDILVPKLPSKIFYDFRSIISVSQLDFIVILLVFSIYLIIHNIPSSYWLYCKNKRMTIISSS